MPVTVRFPAISWRRPALPIVLVAALLPLPLTMMATACSSPGPTVDTDADAPAGSTSNAAPAPADDPEATRDAATRRAALARPAGDEAVDHLDAVFESWTGDLDGMIEREVIRALVPMSKTFYFLDGAEQKGIGYDAMQLFEQKLNEDLDRGNLKVHVLMVPVARDELLPGLVNGHGDIALGALTITPERQALVDFSVPTADGVSEIVVTGPQSPAISTLDDLAGQEVVVRPSSSYYQSLLRLNERFRAEGKAEILLTAADELLEDEDLLEMVNAGLLPIVVVDSYKAELWARIFTDLVVHEDVAVATDQNLGWAFRRDSPQLAAVVNDFVAENRRGTLMGNIIFNRYLADTKWAERALNDEGRAKVSDLAEIFRRYGDQYEMPWLLIAAQGYQESRLDQSVVSPVGAIGVMQLLPSTAADPNVGIPDIDEVENNIHAGTKYLRFIHDRYFADSGEMEELDKALFSFAAYNAGPARVARLRGKADDMGLDPNVWFRNVEIVAAQDIGRETVQYVSNIFKYYTAYDRMMLLSQERQQNLPE